MSKYMRTWLRCQFGRQTLEYRRWLGRCVFPPRRVLWRHGSVKLHQQCYRSKHDIWIARNVPTVIGLICTPCSSCAIEGSSESLCSSTFWPQSVFTNVVLPMANVISRLVSPLEQERKPTSSDVGSAEAQRTSPRSTTYHQAELDALLDVLLPANLIHCLLAMISLAARAPWRL
jgi:hypothetical protein